VVGSVVEAEQDGGRWRVETERQSRPRDRGATFQGSRMSKSTERLEKWTKGAAVAGAVIAALSLVATAIFSLLTLRAANTAINETRSQAWGVQGAANCHNYREEVRELVKDGVPPREIRAWFAAEGGGIENPYVKGTSRTGLEDYEDGCGHIDLLVAVLDPKAEPSGEVLARDGVSEVDIDGD